MVRREGDDIQILAALLDRLAEDRTAGIRRPLSDYQDLFPGNEALIAEEWARLTDEGESPDDAVRFGPYVLERLLGEGAFGKVHMATDRQLGRRVAIKILSGRHRDREVERLRQEARILARLDHPAIARILEVGDVEGVPYLALQLVEGLPLSEVLVAARKGGSIELIEGTSATPRDLARFFEASARAVHSAHELGLIHRDIKPANIMVTRGGEPVVLDFGAALPEGGGVHDTRALMGTPAYMAPEQRRFDAHPDRSADVFALGATLYETLSGMRAAGDAEPPWSRPAPSIDRVVPTLDADLRAIVARATAEEPRERYSDALTLAEDLRRYRHFEPIEARRIGALSRLLRWRRRNRLVAALTGAMFFLLTAGVIWTQLKNIEVRNALDEKNAALAHYFRISDVKRLRDAKKAAAALFPPGPELTPDLENWQAVHGKVFTNLADHEVALARIREAALPYSDDARSKDHAAAFAEIAALEAERQDLETKLKKRDSDKLDDRIIDVEDRLSDLREAVAVRKSWAFSDDNVAFRHETLESLVADLEVESGPEGVWASVAKRLERSRTIKAKTVDEFADEWSDTIAGVAASAEYDGLRIAPQIGLIPLGRDPSSRLFEFLHWLSHEPEAPLPVRNALGRFEVKAETGIILVLLPEGDFLMGAQSLDVSAPNYDPEASAIMTPVHRVRLEPFLMGKYEVTQAQWLRMTGENPSHYIAGIPIRGPKITVTNPVEQVDWSSSVEAARRQGVELPSEAQWEYACRAGTSTPFISGMKLSSGTANIADESSKEAWTGGWVFEPGYHDGFNVHAPVGSFAANAFGLFDMHGNVWEWCRDDFVTYASDNLRAGDGLRLGEKSRARIVRGGGFLRPAVAARSAYRLSHDPVLKNDVVGLRFSMVVMK